MPGFGQADKPAKFDYSPAGYAAFLEKLFSQLGIEQVHLVLHDFGGPWGLAWATSHPTGVRSVALFNVGVPLGYHWHSTAKLVRRPILGELIGEAQLIVGWEAYPEDVAPLVHGHPSQYEAMGETMLAMAGKPLHVHD